jgi:hypothetical protein
VAWHGDGTRLASGGDDGTVRVWDATTYAELARLEGHGDWVWSVAWHGDGTQLASGGDDGTVRVWDVGNADAQTPCRVVITVGDHGSFAAVPSGYVRINGPADRLLLQLEASSPRIPGVTRFLPLGALRPFFERPDLVTRSLAGEAIPTTPLEDLRAAGWSPGPMWDGSPAVLTESPEHTRRAIDAPAATPRIDAPSFVPGPAITDGRDLDGRAALIDELLRLTAARTPTALLGPRRAGKTSLLHTLAARLRGTHEVYHATLEGAQLTTRDDLARRLAPALAAHPAPAEALLQARPELPAVYLLDELAWLARLPADHLAWLRALGQHAAMLVLAGSHQDWRTVAAHARTAPGSSFANDVWVVEVGPMARRDAAQFLVTTSAGRISEDLARLIVEVCGGWPFYLQVMGFAVEQELRVGRAVVVRDQVLELRHRRLIVDRDPVFAGRWAELPALARATLLAHRDQLPRLDDLSIDAADAVLGAGLATPAGIWLDDIPWFQWVRLHARRLARAEGV